LLRGRAIRVAERPADDGAPAEDAAAARLGAFDPPEAVIAPPHLTNVGGQPPFVGREAELRRLDEELLGWRLPPGELGCVVVHGIGGVGKTALATRWAAGVAAGDVFTPVWRVRASSPETIDSGLDSLTRALQPSVTESLAGPDRVEWALRWLRAHDAWVLVLDSVADPADVRELLARLGTGGSVLITSRVAEGWEGVAVPIPLDVPAPAEAAVMLEAYAGRDLRGADPGGAHALCAELGRLPLALAMAGSHLARTGESVAEYLAALGEGTPDDGDGGVATRSIRDVFEERLRDAAADPAASRLLLTLAWYAAEPVPHDLLPPVMAEAELPGALRFLADSGLVRLENDMVSVHAVLAEVARAPDPDPRVRGARDIDDARIAAARHLRKALPDTTDDPGAWPRWRRLLPHIEALLERTRSVDDNRHFMAILTHTAQFLLGQGQVEQSIDLLRRALLDGLRLSGREAPGTLSVASRLADAFVAAGDTGHAIELYMESLEALDRAGRPVDDPDVLETRAALAAVRYRSAGEVAPAVRELEEVCHLALAALGEDHPTALHARVRLAGACLAAEEFDRATALYEETLATAQRVHGRGSPFTLTVRGELAAAHQAVGDAGRAIGELERMAAECRRTLGEDHPLTLTALSALAGVYESEGVLDHAIGLYEDALGLGIRALGAAHPDTSRLRERLAHACVAIGDQERVVRLREETLTTLGETEGRYHPETLRAAASLAGAYRRSGARDKALALYERTLTERVRVLGASHAETRRSYEELAETLCEAGEPRRAIPLIERTLDERVSSLGGADPETVRARDALADACRQAGDPGAAVELCQASLDALKHSLGEDHIRTHRARARLARALAAADDMKNAVRQLGRAVHGLARELGEDAAETLATRTELARWQERRS
ncbi:tetratricopeptide repeat protein, partial [Streptomyces flavofungini]|uniref:tetratricopeptide repeat protein n=1 Tax=Streptomyces flavofungini TaxID=68200 RepID=UPI0034DF5C1E